MSKEERLTRFINELVEHTKEGTAGEFLQIDESYYVKAEKKAYELYRRGRHEDAATLVRGVNDLDPKRPYPYLVLGDLKLKKGEPKEAVPYFLSGLTFAPRSPVFQTKLAECYLMTGAKGGAAKLLNEVLANPDISQAQQRRASALLKVAVAA